MATLAQERISVTVPVGVANFLRRRAEAADTSIDDVFADVVGGVMDHEEDDDLTEEEERRLVERAERNEAESTRFYTYEEVLASLR